MAEAVGVFLIDGEGTDEDFDSRNTAGSNTFAEAGAAANNGSNGQRATFDGSNALCDGVFAYANQADLYFRFYVRLNSGLDTPGDGIISLGRWETSGSLCGYIGTYTDGGSTPNNWYITTDWGGALLDNTNFSIGSWIRIETRLVVHSSTGGMLVWINGTQIVDAKLALTYNNTGYNNNTLIIGNTAAGTVPGNGDTIDFDDIKCDTSAIGAYSDVGGGGSIVPLVMAYHRRLRS